jgi:hypothetical protein
MLCNATQHVCLNGLPAIVRTRIIPALALALWAVLATTSAQSSSSPSLTVRVYNHARVSDEIVADAEQTAGRILRKAEIGTAWIACLGEEAERHHGCRKEVGTADVMLLVVSRWTMDHVVGREAFGLALPSGDEALFGQASAFHHCVEEAVRRDGSIHPARLLGHVIAHEIGHLLLGPGAHTLCGIMCPSWRKEDLQEMAAGTLLFFPSQARVMQAALARRVAIEMAAARVSPRD